MLELKHEKEEMEKGLKDQLHATDIVIKEKGRCQTFCFKLPVYSDNNCPDAHQSW